MAVKGSRSDPRLFCNFADGSSFKPMCRKFLKCSIQNLLVFLGFIFLHNIPSLANDSRLKKRIIWIVSVCFFIWATALCMRKGHRAIRSSVRTSCYSKVLVAQIVRQELLLRLLKQPSQLLLSLSQFKIVQFLKVTLFFIIISLNAYNKISPVTFAFYFTIFYFSKKLTNLFSLIYIQFYEETKYYRDSFNGFTFIVLCGKK